MTQRLCSLGLDIGTTSVKVVAFDSDRRIVARAEGGLTLASDADGRAEQDPRAVYETVIQQMVSVIKTIRAQGYGILRVGFSSAMHSLFLVSTENEPLTNAMTWMDRRAAKEAEDLWDDAIGRRLYGRTGTPVHPMTPLAKLLWLKRTHPVQFNRAAKFISLKEWVWWNWFGVWEIDQSLAGGTGLFNVHDRTWDEEALMHADLRLDQLATIVPTTHIRSGCLEPRLADAGITAETLFNIGASDGVLANLGIGAVDGDALAITIGTSLAVRMGSRSVQTHAAIRSFCYVLDEERYVVGGPSNSGGVVLDWVHRMLATSTQPMGAVISQAGNVSVDDLFCLPYLSGERAPLWDASARASFVGLGLNHTPEHLMRAAIEGVLLNAYWIASELFAQVGKPTRILVSGKLFDVEWVSQLLADLFDLPVQVDSVSDASILGAVELARLACLRIGAGGGDLAVNGQDSPAEAVSADEARTEDVVTSPQYVPRNHENYAGKFQEFRKLASVLVQA